MTEPAPEVTTQEATTTPEVTTEGTTTLLGGTAKELPHHILTTKLYIKSVLPLSHYGVITYVHQ